MQFFVCAGFYTSHNFSDWVNSFDVPSEYSHRTKQLIRSGVLTKTARCEIIAAIATRMVQHTRYPTSHEYQTVCKMLIQKYPSIQDPVGNGYDSKVLILHEGMLIYS